MKFVPFSAAQYELLAKSLKNEIDIHLVNLMQLSDQSQYLTRAEQQRAAKMPLTDVSQKFINARGYLRYLLSHYLQCPAVNIKLATTSKGKLFLENEELHFNLAHSHDFAIYAFDKQNPIGIDLEYPRKLNDLQSIAARVFSLAELDFLNSHPKELQQNFYRLWTRKEAIIKCSGEGLSAALQKITTTLEDGRLQSNNSYHQLDLIDLPNYEDYFCAIAGKLSSKKLKLWHHMCCT